MCAFFYLSAFFVVVVVVGGGGGGGGGGGCLSASGGCDALRIRHNVPRCRADIAQSFIHERFYFSPQSLNQFTGKTKTGPETPLKHRCCYNASARQY